MLKFMVLISLIFQGCATQQFYVQENNRIVNVMVHQCNELQFRNIDTGSIAKRKVCSNKKVSVQEWEQFLNKNDNAVTTEVEEEQHE
jgi:hypothetical protein